MEVLLVGDQQLVARDQHVEGGVACEEQWAGEVLAQELAVLLRAPVGQNLEVRALLKEDIVVQESALRRLQDAHAQLMVTVQDIWRVAREREAALAGQLALLQEGMQTLEYQPYCESRLLPNCPSPTLRDRRRFWK